MDMVKYREYQRQYGIKYLVRLSLALSKENDRDIIDAIKLENKGSKQASLKSLIRKGIKYNELAQDSKS